MDEKSSFRPLTGQDLKEIWKRQRWWVVGTAVFLAAATCLVVGLLPSTYRSDALILIEQPAVSQDFVKPLMGVDDEQQISELVQQVLSRTLVERLPMMKGGQSLSEDDFEALLERMSIETLRENTDPRRPAGKPYGLKVSYSSKDPKSAQEGANELAALVVQEAEQRILQHARDTADLLRTQLAQSVAKVQKADQALADFKKQYAGQLPIEEELTVQTLSRIQAQMDVNSQAMERAKQTITDLRSSTPTAGDADASKTPVVKEDPDLARLQSDLQSEKDKLADLQSRYKPQHPDVIKTQEEIARLEVLVKQQTPKPAAPVAAKTPGRLPAATASRIADNEAELAVRSRQQQELEREARLYSSNLAAIPMRSQQYSDLEREYEAAKKDYETLRDDVAAADQTTVTYEEHKGIRFRIQDYASLPGTPDKPVRWKINLGGLGGALALGLLLAALREFGNTSFKSERDVEYFTGLKTLGFLPTITEPFDQGRARRRRALVISSSIVGALALAVANLYIYIVHLRLF